MSGSPLKILALVRTGRSLPLAVGLGDVCALSLVEPKSEGEATLRTMRAAGASRAVGLWDEQLATTDYYGLAQALAGAARSLGFDVIVCSEGRRGVLGPALADRLSIPHLSGVSAATRRDTVIVAERAVGGVRRAFSAEPPLLLSVAAPSVQHDTDAYAPIERLTLTDIGVSPADLRWRQRFAPRSMGHGPAPRPMVFGTAGELAARLRAEGLIPSRRGPR